MESLAQQLAMNQSIVPPLLYPQQEVKKRGRSRKKPPASLSEGDQKEVPKPKRRGGAGAGASGSGPAAGPKAMKKRQPRAKKSAPGGAGSFVSPEISGMGDTGKLLPLPFDTALAGGKGELFLPLQQLQLQLQQQQQLQQQLQLDDKIAQATSQAGVLPLDLAAAEKLHDQSGEFVPFSYTHDSTGAAGHALPKPEDPEAEPALPLPAVSPSGESCRASSQGFDKVGPIVNDYSVSSLLRDNSGESGPFEDTTNTEYVDVGTYAGSDGLTNSTIVTTNDANAIVTGAKNHAGGGTWGGAETSSVREGKASLNVTEPHDESANQAATINSSVGVSDGVNGLTSSYLMNYYLQQAQNRSINLLSNSPSLSYNAYNNCFAGASNAFNADAYGTGQSSSSSNGSNNSASLISSSNNNAFTANLDSYGLGGVNGLGRTADIDENNIYSSQLQQQLSGSRNNENDSLSYNGRDVQLAFNLTGYQQASALSQKQAAALNGYQQAASLNGFQQTSSLNGFQQAAALSGYNQAAALNGYNQAVFLNDYPQAAAMNGYQQAAAMNGYQQAASFNGYQQAAALNGYQQAAALNSQQLASLSRYQQAAGLSGYGNISSLLSNQLQNCTSGAGYAGSGNSSASYGDSSTVGASSTDAYSNSVPSSSGNNNNNDNASYYRMYLAYMNGAAGQGQQY